MKVKGCGQSHQITPQTLLFGFKCATLRYNSQNIRKVSLSFCDQGSSGDERAMAKEVSSVIGQNSRSEELVAEGQESIEFWELLGGKAPYANEKR